MKVLFIIAGLTASLWAHFQVILPSHSIVETNKDASLSLKYEFTHPFERSLMHMAKPMAAGVNIDGENKDLLPSLQETKAMGLSLWKTTYTLTQPGMYQFYVDPTPYFEPSEGKFIRHQTKVIIDGFGAGEGWDRPLGLKAEIIPLTRPYGLYRGNIFSAQVFYKGNVAPNMIVEVELYNTKNFQAPSQAHITQEVKTDANGIFYFVMPESGWWGFAALIDDDERIVHDGKSYPVELGAVLWLYADEMR